MQTYGVEFLGRIPGPINAETVLVVPGSPWVIMSSLTDPEQQAGVLTAVHAESHEVVTVYPDGADAAYGGKGFDSSLLEQGPGKLFSHGMAIKAGAYGVHRLYVVNHNVANRPNGQSIEAFDVRVVGGCPRLTHLGGVLLPEGRWPTDVVALPGDEEGFITNSLMDPADHGGFDRLAAGEAMGSVLEWTPDDGWSVLPTGLLAAPNGVEISPDGRYVYIACWSIREIWRVERGVPEPKIIRSHANGVLVDNFTWDRGGKLLCAGQLSDPVSHLRMFAAQARCDLPSAVISIDPETLAVETLASGQAPDGWGMASSAVEIGNEIWVGSARSEGVLHFRR